MKYAIYQMEVVPGQPEKNREKISEWMKETVSQEKPDVVVLPELWNTGFTLPELEQLADRNGEKNRSFLQQLGREYGVNIIGGSIATKKDGHFYNTSMVIDRQGNLVYEYDKIHLVPMLNEHLYLKGGNKKVETFELDGVRMGVIICYDLRFPELARKLALDGAEIMHVVAEWPTARRDHWMALQIARAIENQMYVVTCNNVGTHDGVTYGGTSMVTDPWGNQVAVGKQEQEETIAVTLSMEMVPKIREDVPVFSSRVPELY